MAPAPAFWAKPRAIIAFLFDFFPYFIQGALNVLILFLNLKNSQYFSLKERKLFSFHQKAKDLMNSDNHPPISLLEVFYNLTSKILAIKVTPYLPDIIDTFQQHNRPFNR